MGWWTSANGSGAIGDRPADLLGTVLTDSLGTSYDVDLLGGFLAAVGRALLRNPDELVRDEIVPATELVAEFTDHEPVTVSVRPPVLLTGLDDAVHDALEATAFQYRATSMARPPYLDEILETIAFVARGHVLDRSGWPVDLVAMHRKRRSVR